MIIGLIGCGNMGASLVRGLARNKDFSLQVHDRHPERVESAGENAVAMVSYADDASAACLDADAVILAVKPAGIANVLREIAPVLDLKTLAISVAAGVDLDSLEECLEKAAPDVAVVRAMPNVGSELRVGTTAIVLGKKCLRERDEPKLVSIFSAVGAVHFAQKEPEMHGATALAGSGPAFVLTVLEAMIDAGVEAGLRREDASAYARGALRAASALADVGEPPAVIRARITSPGGTTIAGLNAMEDAGVRGAMLRGVSAAVARSLEMAGE